MKDRLDLRLVAYNPDQDVDGPDSLVDLVCPIHGAYRCRRERLRQKYMCDHLRAPGCEGCKEEKVNDREYLELASFTKSVVRDQNETLIELYEVPPEYVPLPHWA